MIRSHHLNHRSSVQLRIQREDNVFVLQYGNRLSNITNSLPRPSKQNPSLIFFIGRKTKTQALQAIFPQNGIAHCRRYGIANICVDPKTAQNDHPLLIADSTPNFAQTDPRGKSLCHETKSYPVAWPDDHRAPSTRQDLVGLLHARLLALFIDVLCIFPEDCGGLEGVAEKIAAWTSIGAASSLQSCIRPRLVVVTKIPGRLFDSEALSFRLRVLADPKFAESFSSLKLVNLLATNRPSQASFGALGEFLTREIGAARSERMSTHASFSMIHVAGFFDLALKNFAASYHQTFDFIQCSRSASPVSPNFANHLKSFLSLSLANKLPETILWDFIGSALILDAFPPDMHLFNPSEVFRILYRQPCHVGIRDYASSKQLSIELVCNNIESNMMSMFSFMKSTGQSAGMLRKQSLLQNGRFWHLLKSNIDCFICLQRKPEHILECGQRKPSILYHARVSTVVEYNCEKQ